jgi:plasmid maintenance system antidote protein VapI
MTQIALPLPGQPVHIDIEEIARQPSGAACLALAASKAGKQDKSIAADLGMQDAVWSRCKHGQNSLSPEQMVALCKVTGTIAPIAWMLLQLGYDPRTLQRIESEVERENRHLREENAQMKARHEIELEAIRKFMGRAA